MKHIKKIIVVSLLILIVPVVVFGFFKPATLTNGIERVAVFTETQAQNLFGLGYWLEGGKPAPSDCPDCVGALTGPDISSKYLSINGFRTEYNSVSMKTATSTICAIKSPTATSSLEFASLDFSVSSTSASVITIAKGATPYATTTIIGGQTAVGANNQANIIASSSSVSYTVKQATTFAPSQYLVVSMQTNGGSGYMSPTGKCKAKFIVME